MIIRLIIHIMQKPGFYNQAFHSTHTHIMDSLTRFFQIGLAACHHRRSMGRFRPYRPLHASAYFFSVLGLFLMLALLGLGIIRPGMVDRGAKWALGELVFFFIPIMVSVLQYQDLLMSEGWQLILTIAVGTALVMISTALTLDFCYRWKRRLYKKLHS